MGNFKPVAQVRVEPASINRAVAGRCAIIVINLQDKLIEFDNPYTLRNLL
jgi:hypothetical protein